MPLQVCGRRNIEIIVEFWNKFVPMLFYDVTSTEEFT
jgi:hypothetical protein